MSIGIAKSVNSQTLYFCEGVDDDGNAITESSTFTINSDGGYLYFLIKNTKAFNCTYLNYELFKINDSGKEVYNTVITQDGMEKNWTYAWKKVTFYQSGKYKVYVKDCNSKTIATNKITIKF